MKRLSIIDRIGAAALLSSFLAAATSFAGASGAQVRLAIDETSILPGTPTGVTVTVTNLGELQLQLPSTLWLTATNDAGHTFVLRSSTLSLESGGVVVPEVFRAVEPNTSRELRFDPSIAVVGSPWFMDSRLWAPGRYRLRAVLSPNVRPDGTYEVAATIASDEQTLTVALPSGDDAAVWKWLQDHEWNEQAWLYRPWQFASFVAKEHPKSAYALFTALYLPVADDKPSPAFEELLKRFPDKSFTEQVKLRRIFYYQQSSFVAYRRADFYNASNDADAARALASGLMNSSRSATVRASAKDYLDHIPTREQLMRKPETR